MGLKTTNYEIKRMDITVPTAYAMIENLEVRGDRGRAEFVIRSARQPAKMNCYGRVRVEFEVDRNESPYVTAYKAAKATHTKMVRNPDMKYITDERGRKVRDPETPEKIEVTVPGPFTGWEDDIIESEVTE